MFKDQHAAAGITGGIILTLYRILHSDDFIKTVLLTAVSAVVSYGVSFLLKFITGRCKK